MTDRRHQELRELLPSYVLGAVEGGDLVALERHLASGCEECEGDLASRYGQLEELARAVAPLRPSEATRARVLTAIGKRRPAWGDRLLKLAAVLVVGLLGWSAWQQVDLRRRVESLADSREQMSSRLDVVQAELELARSGLRRAALAQRIAAAPRMFSVQLAGLEGAPEAFGQTLVDPTRNRAVFYASNLPRVAADQTYQLWFIADGTPVSAGIFQADEDGSSVLIVENVADREAVQAWAVTVEPAGGVPQPTGPMILMG